MSSDTEFLASAGPVFPAELLERCLDDTLPLGVIRVDGFPIPLIEWEVDDEF